MLYYCADYKYVYGLTTPLDDYWTRENGIEVNEAVRIFKLQGFFSCGQCIDKLIFFRF